MSDNAPGSNGRVTLAVLATKLDTILAELQKIYRCDELQNSRLNLLEIGQAQRQTQINQLLETDKTLISRLDDHDDDIKGIDRKTSWWNGANTFGAIIAGVIAFLRGGP